MQKKYCSNCGKPLEPDANFCAFCGAKQIDLQPLPHKEPNTTTGLPQVKPSVPPTNHIESEVYRAGSEIIIPRRRLSPRAVLLFFFNYVATTSVMIPFIIAYGFFEPIIAMIIAACYLAVCYVMATLVYSGFHFSFDENGFEKEYGIIFKHHISIPYEQIQNVNTTETLIDKLIGVSRLEIETAGSASTRTREIIGGVASRAEGLLPGIGRSEAKQLRDLLLRKVATSDD